jgi:hypothetical protein
MTTLKVEAAAKRSNGRENEEEQKLGQKIEEK